MRDDISDLKPCPFCGGGRAFPIPANRKSTERLYPIVRCMGCFTDVPGKNDDFSIDCRTAVAAWDTRALDAKDKQMARRVETRKLTNAEFAQRCAYLAKVTAAWAGDMLTLPEEHHTPVRVETVAMFTAEIRGWLDRLEQQASPAPAHKEQAE